MDVFSHWPTRAMQPKAICCGEKAVLVTVCVERPRRRRKVVPSTPNLHHNLCIREQRLACLKPCKNGGYDRRARLLLYSQHLRETACQQSSIGASASHHHTYSNNRAQPQITKILSVRRRSTRRSPIQACLGHWKRLLIPGFLRSFAGFKWKKSKNKSSVSQPNKTGSIIRSSDMKKKWAVIPKLFAKLYRSR